MKEPQFPKKKIQKHDWFARSRARFQDGKTMTERPEATEKDKEQMEADFIRLGEVFEGCPVKWVIDGGPNVSLRTDDFIGYHKDIDISFEKDELDELEKFLHGKGYAFFWSYRQDGDKVMEHVDAQDFKKDVSKEKRIIAAVNEEGKIISDVPLPNIEVHLIDRDEGGNATGEYGGVLPETWLQPITTEYKGVNLHLSHPARTAYYKLFSTFRAPYHMKDLEALAGTGSLTNEDIDDIEKVAKEEFGDSKDERIPIYWERLLALRTMVKNNTQE